MIKIFGSNFIHYFYTYNLETNILIYYCYGIQKCCAKGWVYSGDTCGVNGDDINDGISGNDVDNTSGDDVASMNL